MKECMPLGGEHNESRKEHRAVLWVKLKLSMNLRKKYVMMSAIFKN